MPDWLLAGGGGFVLSYFTFYAVEVFRYRRRWYQTGVANGRALAAYERSCAAVEVDQ